MLNILCFCLWYIFAACFFFIKGQSTLVLFLIFIQCVSSQRILNDHHFCPHYKYSNLKLMIDRHKFIRLGTPPPHFYPNSLEVCHNSMLLCCTLCSSTIGGGTMDTTQDSSPLYITIGVISGFVVVVAVPIMVIVSCLVLWRIAYKKGKNKYELHYYNFRLPQDL